MQHRKTKAAATAIRIQVRVCMLGVGNVILGFTAVYCCFTDFMEFIHVLRCSLKLKSWIELKDLRLFVVTTFSLILSALLYNPPPSQHWVRHTGEWEDKPTIFSFRFIAFIFHLLTLPCHGAIKMKIYCRFWGFESFFFSYSVAIPMKWQTTKRKIKKSRRKTFFALTHFRVFFFLLFHRVYSIRT